MNSVFVCVCVAFPAGFEHLGKAESSGRKVVKLDWTAQARHSNQNELVYQVGLADSRGGYLTCEPDKDYF